MHQQQTHAAGSLRHAEKRRGGTCRFANRVARASLDAYARSVPPSHRERSKHQTCVAAVVACFRRSPGGDARGGEAGDADADADGDADGGNDGRSRLQVMGLGAGTKFLPDAVLREEERRLEGNGDDACYGKRIRDCHAEVLARRAFRRRVALEMLADLRGDDADGGVGGGGGYAPILERAEGRDGDDGGGDPKVKSRIRYRLRADVTLHFYASSAPCGNAVLKKFVKMSRETFDASLGPDEWPEQRHAPIAAHSLHLGQFALLVKKDGSASPSGPSEDRTTEPVERQRPKDGPGRRKKRRKPWPCREGDAWCPPACSIPHFGRGTLHSCSDKLCRWNCLGLQGALLAAALEGPLHASTVTVGRKFSRATCVRALCGRAEGFGGAGSTGGKGGKAGDGEGGGTRGAYGLNRPAFMETNVYMDESGTHQMAGVKDVGRDASFDSNLCWVWWPGKASKSGYAADCLDGKTGLIFDARDGADGPLDNGRATTPAAFSACSTLSLFRLSMEILRRSGAAEGSDPEDPSELSLPDLRRAKRRFSPQYESAKADLFRHRVFAEWSRRDPR